MGKETNEPTHRIVSNEIDSAPADDKFGVDFEGRNHKMDVARLSSESLIERGREIAEVLNAADAVARATNRRDDTPHPDFPAITLR